VENQIKFMNVSYLGLSADELIIFHVGLFGIALNVVKSRADACRSKQETPENCIRCYSALHWGRSDIGENVPVI
jgi:hypothetical protein